MKLDRVEVAYGGVLNLGNYQSAHIHATVGATLEPGDDPDQVARDLFDQARAMVQERAAPLITNKNALIEGVFTSLPAQVRRTMQSGDGDDIRAAIAHDFYKED